MDSFKPVVKYLSRYFGLIVMATLAIVGVYVSLNYIWPKYQEVQMTREEITALNSKKDELTNYVAYLHELEMTTLPLEEELVNYAIPSENDVISLIVTYEGLSKAEDIEVSPFDLSPGLIQRAKKSNGSDVEIVDEESGVGGTGQSVTQSKELEFKMEGKAKDAETAINFIRSIHNTRRLFNIKSLVWENPEPNDQSEDAQITLSMDLGTYYYQESPKVTGSAALVNKGKAQANFIASLNETTIYDALILDTVEVGKEDLFVLGETASSPAPRPNPTPVLQGDAITDEVNPVPTGAIVTPPSTF